MRRVFAFVLAAVMLMAMATPVFAATAATDLQVHASVSADGSCTVTMNLSLHLDTAVSGLTFPLPEGAKSITLNGSSARTTTVNGGPAVSLSIGKTAGDYTVSIGYQLNDVISRNSLDQLEMNLPLLNGFAYPIQSMSFSVTLPGAVEGDAKPTFTSGYHQASIESMLTITTLGNSFQGTFTQPLKDRETLTMTLLVSENLFPQSVLDNWGIGLDKIAMWVFAVAAVLYWILFLRCLPLKRKRSATPPAGLSAGHLGCALISRGADLTMMVLSWAQLGYILIHLEDRGRVTLHKRMDMGNERSSFENACFKKLFDKRTMVDGTSYHYANLCRKIAAKQADTKAFFHRSSGSPGILRILATLSGFFGAMLLGRGIAGDALFSFLLVPILALLGGIAAWLILMIPSGIHLRYREHLLLGGAGILLWLILGAGSKNMGLGLGMIAFLLIAGIAAAYGGQRTEQGRQTAGQILGFYWYLLRAERGSLLRLQRNNPDYFFSLVPYALALGLDRHFAKRMGPGRLSGCPYLTTGMDGHMNALEWSQVMRRAVQAMDARQKQLPLERLKGK